MATTMRAGDVTLHDLGARLGLQFTKDATFFPEWHAELPELNEQEKQHFDRIQASYLHLVSQASMAEHLGRDGGASLLTLRRGGLTHRPPPLSNTPQRQPPPAGPGRAPSPRDADPSQA
jgi:hypothetical protein